LFAVAAGVWLKKINKFALVTSGPLNIFTPYEPLNNSTGRIHENDKEALVEFI
jgi:hypothetical protein